MGGEKETPWGRYEELRPERLAEIVRAAPVAFWPMGLLEHHGWHLPVGFDGLKADRICRRVAERTGGVVLPVMWWGSGGGHGAFPWSLYQSPEAAAGIIRTTLRKLAGFGFRVIVLLAGHYPWKDILDGVVPPFESEHPGILVLRGDETDIAAPKVRLAGDHAAREETSMGLALMPELVDMDALRPGRGREAGWRGGSIAAALMEAEKVCLDPADPCFAQLGEDARKASAGRGEEGIAVLVEALAGRITAHLQGL
ncbi:MAG: creatininase family protein [Planctomycetota bacterium]|nr:creatininase family protein [Planctomycetota bacterium]